MTVHNAIKLSMRNRTKAENAELLGCYHCLKTFKPTEITAYTDQKETVLCPYCGIDAVLYENITENYLKEIKDYWFS